MSNLLGHGEFLSPHPPTPSPRAREGETGSGVIDRKALPLYGGGVWGGGLLPRMDGSRLKFLAQDIERSAVGEDGIRASRALRHRSGGRATLRFSSMSSSCMDLSGSFAGVRHRIFGRCSLQRGQYGECCHIQDGQSRQMTVLGDVYLAPACCLDAVPPIHQVSQEASNLPTSTSSFLVVFSGLQLQLKSRRVHLLSCEMVNCIAMWIELLNWKSLI